MMKSLEDAYYSREEAVVAFTDFYEFMAKMYMNHTELEYPPPGGWSQITVEKAQKYFGKDEVVADLLRHLPYLKCCSYQTYFNIQSGPWLHFSDHREWFEEKQLDKKDQDFDPWNNLFTEGLDCEHVPPHMVGLCTINEDDREAHVYLDTKLGVIIWQHPPPAARYDLESQTYMGGFNNLDFELDFDYEAPGGLEGKMNIDPAWAIPDFFEMLKERFRRLDFVPIGPRKVWSDDEHDKKSERLLRRARRIYRKHGWPDVEKYDKKKCLLELHHALKDRGPEHVWEGDETNEEDLQAMYGLDAARL